MLNKKLKTIFLVVVSLFFGASFVSASNQTKKLKVVTTIFPIYDWVKNIAGNNVDLVYLMDKGTDLHSWQPSSADIMKISTSDVFIYVGGESDLWVKDCLSTSVNKKQTAINLMEILKDSIHEEELVEGMQAEESENEDDSSIEEEIEYDEHVWLSLRNVKKICSEITTTLSFLDSQNEKTYNFNNNSYSKKLDDLDLRFSKTVENAKRNVVIFADRFPFRYFVEDYNLNYYAAFVGCSAETEASFKTISFLVSKVNDLKVPVVLVLETSDKKIAKTVVQNTKNKNQKILILDSMQSTTIKEINEGKTYLSIMEKNLKTVAEALN